MKILLCTFLLLLSLDATAQFDIGTTWIYSLDALGITRPSIIKITKDTTINNQNWQILQGVTGCGGIFVNCVIRKDGGQVFLLDVESNEETLLYDFNLTEGATYEINLFDTGTSNSVTIDSVGTMNIDGVDHKVQYISSSDFGNYIIEGIGSNSYLVPQGNICDPAFYGIRCFSTDTSFVDFDPNHECYEAILITNIDKIDIPNVFELSPNPSQGNVWVRNISKKTIDKIEVLDLRGNLVLTQQPLPFSDYQIDLSEFNQGMYLIRAFIGHEFTTKKLIID